jgi:hypothetical protein
MGDDGSAPQRRRGLESNTKGLQQLALLAEEIADTSYLLAKGLARKPRLLALQRTEADAAGQVERNAASLYHLTLSPFGAGQRDKTVGRSASDSQANERTH